jgi:hypothetical protein
MSGRSREYQREMGRMDRDPDRREALLIQAELFLTLKGSVKVSHSMIEARFSPCSYWLPVLTGGLGG